MRQYCTARGRGVYSTYVQKSSTNSYVTLLQSGSRQQLLAFSCDCSVETADVYGYKNTCLPRTTIQVHGTGVMSGMTLYLCYVCLLVMLRRRA